jgi:hypothetical protein
VLDVRARLQSLPAGTDGPTVQAADEEESAGAAGALDKHEVIGPPPPGQCTCRPKNLRLLSNHGEIVHPRGKLVNRCEHCAKLAAIENVEMLTLDALEGNAPTILMVNTSRTATLQMAGFKQAHEKFVKAMRRRHPGVEYVRLVEYTTGYAATSGGQRRPHENWLVKGWPVDQVDELRELNARIWCQHVDALPAGQYVQPIENAIGASKYIAEHYAKADQRPPKGFSGHRFVASRGYFGELTVMQARARARDALAHKREIWRAIQAGHEAHDVELLAHEAMRLAARTRWVLANPRGARLGSDPLPEHELPWRMLVNLKLPPRPAAAAATPEGRERQRIVGELQALGYTPAQILKTAPLPRREGVTTHGSDDPPPARLPDLRPHDTSTR